MNDSGRSERAKSERDPNKANFEILFLESPFQMSPLRRLPKRLNYGNSPFNFIFRLKKNKENKKETREKKRKSSSSKIPPFSSSFQKCACSEGGQHPRRNRS